MSRIRTSVLALTLFACLLAAPLVAAVDPALLAGMKARSIGPAGMSGRIADIAAVPSNPDVIYVGAATGGLWKSVSGGLAWEPIFDDQPVAAIGAVAIDPNNPDVVWVGTGEANPRNSVSVGNGVYRSPDGGATWTHLGLDATEHIHRIVLHPDDPAVVWVAATGKTWAESRERGVYKTTDGGRSWRQVLYVDERTGAADLVADPTNPDKLFAAMWDHRRWPWFFRSGGPGSGLWRSWDGGESWQRLTPEDGLPEGDLGRIGLAICRDYPEVVYALVEAETSALLRSEDGGRTFRTVNDEPGVASRPFYYADVRADPEWPQRVYNLASRLSVSDDGGRTFERLPGARRIHGDFQAMWIHPEDPSFILLGSDGGMGISRDRGATWRFVANLPLGQYYHIAVDMERPYNVYGGMQDNGSWRGPSWVRGWRGIPSHRWIRLGGGDGFDTKPDPDNARAGYSMWQGGALLRWNLDTRTIRPIMPPPPEDVELRFNWNAGLAIDPFDPATVYYGSQFVHKSTDRGRTWTVISEDLTTNNPEWQRQAESGGLTPDVTNAENFTTIIAIAPSTVERGVIWVGTDDGRLHITRDGGQSWTSVEGNVRGVPAHTWIPHVEPSHFDAGEAFVVFDDHRRGNWTPYVYRTADYGQSWQSLARDDLWGYALAIVQDPVAPDLLFLGTEFGLWASFDRGASWFKWTHGVPTVSVMDLVVHPRDHDLVLGTHGRSAFVLDDVAPLRELAQGAPGPVHLFAIPDAYQFSPEMGVIGFGLGAGAYEGENRPFGALISYWLEDENLPHPDEETERARLEAKRRTEAEKGPAKDEAAKGERRRRMGERGRGPGRRGPAGRGPGPGGEEEEGPQVTIEIADAAGKTVRTFKGPARQGLNRTAWDLGRDPFKRPPGARPRWGRQRESGPPVPPGEYTVTVRHGDHEAQATVTVLADPAVANTEADWQAREEAFARAGDLQNRLTEAVERILDVQSDLEIIVGKAKKAGEDEEESARSGPEAEGEEGAGGPHGELIKTAEELGEKLTAIEERLRQRPGTKGIVARTQVSSDLRQVMERLEDDWDPPTPSDLIFLERAEHRLAEVLAELDQLFAEEVAAFRAQFRASGLGLLPEEPPPGPEGG